MALEDAAPFGGRVSGRLTGCPGRLSRRGLLAGSQVESLRLDSPVRGVGPPSDGLAVAARLCFTMAGVGCRCPNPLGQGFHYFL
jgi:hypothetical protein